MKIVKKPENNVIILNGTAWDRFNLTVSGQVHFTHEEATRLALQEGKRLPDRFDIGQLQNLYRVEDKELHGVWFAEKKKLLKTDQSLFLPFLGYKSPYECDIIDENNSFQFWGSGRDGSIRDNRFYFCGAKSYMTKGYISGDYRFTVRCVKDLE